MSLKKHAAQIDEPPGRAGLRLTMTRELKASTRLSLGELAETIGDGERGIQWHLLSDDV